MNVRDARPSRFLKRASRAGARFACACELRFKKYVFLGRFRPEQDLVLFWPLSICVL